MEKGYRIDTLQEDLLQLSHMTLSRVACNAIMTIAQLEYDKDRLRKAVIRLAREKEYLEGEVKRLNHENFWLTKGGH